jgi:polyvinyl alcohol dehydrogenase (cytochrome)
MWGYGVDRTFSTSCQTPINATTVTRLRRRWFFNAGDVMTATPAVVAGTAYVGDWAGTFYALRLSDGRPRWTFRTKPHPDVYAGQIVSSAAVADVGGERIVYFGGGKTVYALRAADGSLRWRHELEGDPTEVETSPAVVRGKVIVGFDVHNSDDGSPSGLVALDAASGKEEWTFRTTPAGGTGPGCGDVWGSPSVDLRLGLVFADTGNCTTSPTGYGRYSEAIFAVDLDTGRPRWSYRPHEPNRDDLDFAGAPNLFDAGGRALVGAGNKDGTYYAVDRRTGDPVWQAKATDPGLPHPGGNFSTGGFIGPTAYADGVIVGGTAVGPAPYLHAIDAASGRITWQNPEPNATYAPAAEANGVVFIGGTTDFTLRAFELQTGRKLWSEELKGGVAGGAVVVGDSVVAVAGIREPGVEKKLKNSGVYLFSLSGRPVASSSTTTTRAPTATSVPEDAGPRACVSSACALRFDLKKPPAGLQPAATLKVTVRPWAVEFKATGLGPPPGWLRPGSAAAQAGATVYGLFISESDDNPTGGLVCVLDDDLGCTSRVIPRPGATYNRITLLALEDANAVPTLADGFDRLVVTQAFSPPLVPVAR